MNKFWKCPSLIFLVFIAYGCGSNKYVQTSADESNWISSPAFDFKAYHFSSDSTEVHFLLNTSDYLATRTSESNPLAINVDCELRISSLNSNFLDTISSSLIGKNLKDEIGKYYFKIPFELPSGDDYKIIATLKDENKGISYTQDVYLSKQSTASQVDIIVYKKNSQIPVFSRFLSENSIYEFRSGRFEINSFDFLSSLSESNLPPPPYSSSKNEPPLLGDFTKTEVVESQEGVRISFIESRNLLIKGRSLGMTFLIRPENYPELVNAYEMIQPLRYISARKEFERMNNSVDLKNSLDKFWLDCGESQDRSQELIKNYYSRVLLADQLFTDFKTGWKTDRGLIYIVFGNPSKLTTTRSKETWTYGDKSDLGSVEFVFNKKENDFSENYYVLERSPIYKSEWAKHVSFWRNGRIFN